MSTRLLPLALAGVTAMVLSSCASLGAGRAAQPTIEIHNGGHVVVWSAYLRDGDDPAVVRGMARRALLWRGPVSGHLDVTAYGADGQVLARRATRWSGSLGGRHATSAPFQGELGVPRGDVTRLRVAYAPGQHDASESFQ